MDFVVELPLSQQGNDAKWVIMDQLAKLVHFLLMHMTHFMEKLAQIYVNGIVRLHGIPVSIVSNRDLRFTSLFWKSLHGVLRTKLKFSTAFHPQTDG